MTQKMSAKTLVTREREQKALKLRLAGATYQAIGDALDVTEQAAYKMVARVMDRTVKGANESADQLRLVELARLDRLYIKMSPLAEQGSMGAVDRCLRIMERRARLLGLDAPARTDITSGGDKIIVTLVKDEDAG